MCGEPIAQFLIDLSMHVECRPNPYYGETDMASSRQPGVRVTAPVYNNGLLDHYTEGTIVSYDEIDHLVTVFYKTPQPNEGGDHTSGVMAYPVSLGHAA